MDKGLIDSYLEKHSFKELQLLPLPSSQLGMVLVIPSFCERDLIKSLQSIHLCDLPDCDVEVIVIINASENSSQQEKAVNEQSFIAAKEWAEENPKVGVKHHFLLKNELPYKHAGVGLARKIGMDEAAARLFSVGCSDAPIVCFDADSSCQQNFLREVHEHFLKHSKISACSIYFEHPLQGNEFSEEVYSAIYFYELHLRYYRQGLVYTAAPFAFHTIGSSMAVRALDYCKQGGMNKRKAGEDFYFLQKFIELGQLDELNSTMLIPSARPSDRVPFGTGKAVMQQLAGDKDVSISYHPLSFDLLKKFFDQLEDYYAENEVSPPNEIVEFFGCISAFREKIQEIKSNSSDFTAFKKRFFRWFNAFKSLKFIHFHRERVGSYPLLEAAVLLEKKMGREESKEKDVLKRYRNYDRQFNSVRICDEN